MYATEAAFSPCFPHPIQMFTVCCSGFLIIPPKTYLNVSPFQAGNLPCARFTKQSHLSFQKPNFSRSMEAPQDFSPILFFQQGVCVFLTSL